MRRALPLLALCFVTGCGSLTEPPGADHVPFWKRVAAARKKAPPAPRPALVSTPGPLKSEPELPETPQDPGASEVPADEPKVSAEAAPSLCPAGMILIDGLFCPDARQTCLRWLDKDAGVEPKRCAEFSKNVTCVGNKRHLRYCIDRYEYAPKPDDPPMGGISWTHSKELCESFGKRLCLEAEWTLACEGEDMWPYPTGFTRPADVCNFDVMELLDENHKMRDLRKPAADLPECRSPYGLMNMVGNVDEWVFLEGRWTPWRAGLKGGWWLAGRNRCRPATTGHDEYFTEIQTGFRCCQDVPAEKLDAATKP